MISAKKFIFDSKTATYGKCRIVSIKRDNVFVVYIGNSEFIDCFGSIFFERGNSDEAIVIGIRDYTANRKFWNLVDTLSIKKDYSDCRYYFDEENLNALMKEIINYKDWS